MNPAKFFNAMLRRGLSGNRKNGKRKYHRECRLSQTEVIVIMILFHCSNHKCLKYFYLNEICVRYRHLFPETVSYNRFTEPEKSVVVRFVIFVKKCLSDKCTGISFVDSTLLRMCRSQRIHIHKVFKGMAQRGKCSLGWFYGFKLHPVCNDKGEILNFMITPGDVDERKPLKIKSFIEYIYRKLVGDKGYIGKDLFNKLFIDGIQPITKLKNNMKGRLRPAYDRILLRKRAMIETIDDELKNIAQIEHSRHRSFSNFIVNLIGGIAVYCLFSKKSMINLERIYDNQLILF